MTQLHDFDWRAAVPQLANLDAELQRRHDARCRADFRAFVDDTYLDLTPGWHLDDLCWHLQRFAADVVARRSPRLIVTMPPRHTKSTAVSQRFPVWGMGNWQWQVILATYGQDLADDHSRTARELARSETVRRIFPDIAPPKPTTKSWHADYRRADTDQVRTWTTGGPVVRGLPRRGKYKAVGVGGPLTGSGADVLAIDDPHKDRADADSAASREAVWRWYTSTAYTRLAPGGGILLVLTRWHDDDLAGRLLRNAANGTGEPWQLVSFPAIAEVDEYGPAGQLRRRAGDALHPARYDLDFLQRVKAQNPYDFASLYQQRPVPAEGALVKAAHLAHRYTPGRLAEPVGKVAPSSPTLAVPGAGCRQAFRLLSADTASKTGELNDYSVILSLVEVGQQAYLCDVQRRRLDFPALVAAVVSLAQRDDPHAVLIEDKGSGQALIQQLRQRSDWRWSIVPVLPKVDKVTRMATETPWLEAGRLLLPETAHWLPDFEHELLTFPAGSHDDQVDALSQAIAYLRGRSAGGTLSAWANVHR